MSTPPPLVVYGAGGHGREVAALLADLNDEARTWRVLGFLDDHLPAGSVVNGLPVLGGAEWVTERPGEVHVALGVGSPALKRRLVAGLRGTAAGFPALVHPGVVRTEHVRLHEGAMVAAGSVLTVQVEVGAFATVNVACSISHDTRIGAYATLAPGCRLSGNVRVEEGCDLGTGTIAIPGVTVGAWTVVGAGAVVVSDLPGDCTAVGVPARIIKESAPAGATDNR